MPTYVADVRYWSNSGQRPDLGLNGSVACAPGELPPNALLELGASAQPVVHFTGLAAMPLRVG
jgi:hypothetical protein